MRRFVIIIYIVFVSIIGFCQHGRGRICNPNGDCIFELRDPPDTAKGYTTDGAYIEKQIKNQTEKKTACDVLVWRDGDIKNKIYNDFVAYNDPVEIVNKSTGKQIIKFQYIGVNKDAAVEAFNDVVFVDHDFTMYLVMPEHNCHGKPTSPTKYVSCGLCGKQYKIQEFYNDFTQKHLSIYIGARNCKNVKSITGNCDNLVLEDVPKCPKLDQPDCDQIIKGGDVNK